MSSPKSSPRSSKNSVTREITTSENWDQVISGFQFVPPGQAEIWRSGPSAQSGKIIRLASDSPGRVALQGIVKEKFGFTRLISEDGPLIGEDCTENEFLEFMTDLRQRLGSCFWLSFSSVSIYQSRHEVWLRRAGFQRPITAVACPMTFYIDLTRPDELTQKMSSNWRHNYNRSKKAGLTFEVYPASDSVALQKFAEIYAETAELKGMGAAWTPEMLERLSKETRLKVFLTSLAGRPISGRLVYFQNQMAFDFLAGTRQEGRKIYASYFLMMEMFKVCREAGATRFDFGRIGPGKYDSVYQFKKGLGGELVTYLGEWTQCSNPYLDYVLGFLRFLRRKERW